MQNHHAPGTSLRQFYESQQVTTPKSHFPYRIFDSLSSLNWTALPKRSDELKNLMTQFDETDPSEIILRNKIDELSKEDPFFSILKKKTIWNADLESCENAWQEGWIYANFVIFYNDADVIGFTEALVKYSTFNKTMKLDVLKMSMSLPGLTKRYMFQNLPKGDFFSGFGEEHKWMVKDLQNSITGGPSIVFHRWHEQKQTTIKIIDDNFCRCVLGYDANSLYLYCFGPKMPTGWYELLEKRNCYQRSSKYSQQSIQSLEYKANTHSIHIQHAGNGGEHRIDNYKVDGFDEVNNTVSEFHGCFWHVHLCPLNADLKNWDKTSYQSRWV